LSKKKLAAIMVPCVVAIIAVIVITNPRQPTPAGQTYTLTTHISPSGAGSIAPSGGEYQSGVQVRLTASPASGYRFVNWTGNVSTIADVEDATTTITMNDHYSITANFALEIIEIRDWYDLDAVRDNLAGSYLLMHDLDSTTAGYVELASETANGGRGWEPIGASDDGFTGSLNGQGHEIRDLFINRPDQDYVGLFARVSWIHPVENVGVIGNVGVVEADVTGAFRVGVLVGHNAGIVSNAYSTCRVTSEGWYVGGMVGYNDGGFVSDCYSTGNVTAARYVGGLVGHTTGARTVREGTVRNCYSTSSVTGFARVGGLVGSTLADVNVSNSYFAGSVAGYRWVGGLVAENYGGNVSNSYSIGNVTGDGGCVGSLVGLNLWGTISNCYSSGMASGNGPVGGLVGENSEGTVSNSFWDIETGDQATSDGGTGRTTAEMKNIATFSGAGWNIIAVNPGMRDPSYIWNIVDGLIYPFLSWQSIPQHS
jgi:hypothetical protein